MIIFTVFKKLLNIARKCFRDYIGVIMQMKWQTV